MEETAFYGVEEHRVSHKALLSDFRGLANQLGQGRGACSRAFLNHVEDELLNHIQLEVLELSRHFRGSA